MSGVAPNPKPDRGTAESLEDRLASLIGNHEVEAERIGRLLHDDVGQILSGVGLQLESLRLDCENDAGMCERIGLVQNALEHAMSKVRELSTELNPSAVERSGLQFALERLVARTGKAIRLQFDSSVRLPREAAKAFYRVTDYAVQSAVRSGAFKQIDIQVKHSRNAVVLEIRHGAETQVPSSGHVDRVELLMLHHYATRAGIPVSIESAPGKGTTVRANYVSS